MTEEENPGTTYNCIIGYEAEPRLLLIEGVAGWALPQVWGEGGGWIAHNGDQVRALVREKYNLDATAMRHLDSQREAEFCELEILQTNCNLPAGARWIGEAELSALKLERENDRPFLDAWLAETSSGQVPPLRPPWERRGWLDEALAWIDAQVERTGEVGYVKIAWGGSYILRVPIAGEDLYFKAVYTKPPGEVALVAALAERWPDNVPTIVAADLERRWMLMRDFGQDRLEDKPDARWGEAAQLLAEVQIDCAQYTDRWFALGCPLRGPEQMPAQIDRLLADETILTSGKFALNAEEMAKVHAAVPRWRAMWAELGEYQIPLSLHQQDFREGNLVVTGDTYLFYDWGDTVVAHPFFSAHRLLDYISPPEGVAHWEGYFAHPEDTRRRCIRDRYLEPWTRFESMKNLIEAFALSRHLNELYQSIRWFLELSYLEPVCPWYKVLYRAPARVMKNMLQADRDASNS